MQSAVLPVFRRQATLVIYLLIDKIHLEPKIILQ